MTAHDAAAPATREQLEAAYDSGDFAKLRREARRVLAHKEVDAPTREVARALLARTAIDRWTLAVLGFAALSFCVIVLRYVF
jgi:hypothetical protein